ncbi:DEKNAAC101859 [Brettanomyces naardenensis]|uniref:DEKNAAC101859 n=1 Tax=Brettanomyces naardenensis TaxID=13370 RepID=A0A448YJC0_BRENA|nr:DEKNAAC101859 [Brettanomyces naardenensis]
MSMITRSGSVRQVTSALRFFSTTSVTLSGHSKWDNIKHKKAANDAAKAASSFKMSSKITVLAKMGGVDMSRNLQLAYAVEKAKSLSIPKRVIENAIKRGNGELKNGNKVESVTYEGLGPGGVAVVIEAITDNKNRTIGMIRPCFNKYNSNMTPTAYMFDKKGLILVDLGETEFDEAFDDLLEMGCEDINEIEVDEGETEGENGDGSRLVELVTDPKEFGKIANAVKDQGKYKIKEMEIGYVAKEDMKTEITNEDTRESFDKFIQSVEELDDVEKVYTNVD